MSTGTMPVGAQTGLGDYLRLDGYMTLQGDGLGHDVSDITYEPPLFIGLRVVSAAGAYLLARKFSKKTPSGHTNAILWGVVGGILNPFSIINRFMN